MEGQSFDSLPSYKSFAEDFSNLGNEMSIITYELWFGGRYAYINGQGVSLLSLATSTVNDSSGQFDPAPHTMCQDTVFQPVALAAMAAVPPVQLVQFPSEFRNRF